MAWKQESRTTIESPLKCKTEFLDWALLTSLVFSWLSTDASVSFNLFIFRQSKDTITLDIKATKAIEPMTPAKTTEPTQMESTSSYSGSVIQKLWSNTLDQIF